MCLVSSLNVSQKAMLLISDSKFYQSCQLISQTTFENKQVNFKTVLSQNRKKMAERFYLARYCDESHSSFKTLPKLFLVTVDDNRGNIAG